MSDTDTEPQVEHITTWPDGTTEFRYQDGYAYRVSPYVAKACVKAAREVEELYDGKVASLKAIPKVSLKALAESLGRNVKGMETKAEYLDAALQGWACGIYRRHMGQEPGFVPIPTRNRD
jgi:histidine ammonia-lyase